MIRRLLRNVRANALVNTPVRTLIRLGLDTSKSVGAALSARWPVAGDLDLELHGVRFRLHNDCDDHVATRIFYGTPHEPGETKLWTCLVPHARVILDVGANTGLYSVLAGVLNPTAAIVAFEPHPANFRRLQANLALNRLDAVRAQELAVGDRVAQIQFTIPENEGISLVSSAVGSFSEAFFDIKYKKVDVSQTALDVYLAERRLAPVDLMVLDVEYYELEVLRGATRMLREDQPAIIAEVFNYDVLAGDHPELRDRISRDHTLEIERLMATAGYVAYAIGVDGLLKVRDLRSIPGGDSNYLFTTNRDAPNYIPFRDETALRVLLPRRATP